MEISSESVRIRTALSSHVGAMIRIADATNLSPWSAQNYLDELRTDAAIILCLEHPSKGIIGFIVGRTVPGDSTNAIDAEIYNVAVVEPQQGKGNGQHLFDTFLEKCVQKTVCNIWLEVRESNRKAIDFYLRNGFEHVQSRQNFYENPREHALLMRRKLK